MAEASTPKAAIIIEKPAIITVTVEELRLRRRARNAMARFRVRRLVAPLPTAPRRGPQAQRRFGAGIPDTDPISIATMTVSVVNDFSGFHAAEPICGSRAHPIGRIMEGPKSC